MFNETSCVGCHNLGGVGGGGGNEHNVTILTAFAGSPSTRCEPRIFQGELEALHPGLKNRASIVLHKHSASAEETDRLTRIGSYTAVQTREDMILLIKSARNTPALFGAGLIDALPDDLLLAAEKRRFTEFPEIKGRVSRLRDGRLGRFGWKGQTSRLNDFVLAACSNELGLEVTGHHQASLTPWSSFDPATLKPDLDARECRLLVEFVARLPRPGFTSAAAGATLVRGREVFGGIGCATCHAPVMGRVDGLFSDLLLHDLGDRFRDSGSGYGAGSTPGRVSDRALAKAETPSTGEAAPTEWRTAPLWGVADSAPYLHDGRAATLDEAIRLHGGEATETSARYQRLSHFDRQCLLAFLHSLTAPRTPSSHADKRPKSQAKHAVHAAVAPVDDPVVPVESLSHFE